jgi:hypothetical protein
MNKESDMNRTFGSLVILSAVGLVTGCQSSSSDTERGPDRTVAYYIKVDSSMPGVAIETNKVIAGKTPLTLRVFGDVAGGFHNLGSPEFLVRALPSNTNEFTQTKSFRTGKNSAPGDRIPGFIFFDMSRPTSGISIDSVPER